MRHVKRLYTHTIVYGRYAITTSAETTQLRKWNQLKLKLVQPSSFSTASMPYIFYCARTRLLTFTDGWSVWLQLRTKCSLLVWSIHACSRRTLYYFFDLGRHFLHLTYLKPFLKCKILYPKNFYRDNRILRYILDSVEY